MADSPNDTDNQGNGVAPIAAGALGAYGGALAASHLGTGEGLTKKREAKEEDLKTKKQAFEDLLDKPENAALKKAAEDRAAAELAHTEAFKAHVEASRKAWGPEFPKMEPAEQVKMRIAGLEESLKYYKSLPEKTEGQKWVVGYTEAGLEAAKKFDASKFPIPDGADAAAIAEVKKNADEALMHAIYGDVTAGAGKFQIDKPEPAAKLEEIFKRKGEQAEYDIFRKKAPKETVERVTAATKEATTALTEKATLLKTAEEAWQKVAPTESGAVKATEKIVNQLKATETLVAEDGLSHLSRPFKMVFGEATAGRKGAVLASAVALCGVAYTGTKSLKAKKPEESYAQQVKQETPAASAASVG